MYLFTNQSGIEAQIGYDTFSEILQELKLAGLPNNIFSKIKDNDEEYLNEEECDILYKYLEPLSQLLQDDAELLVARRLEFMAVVLAGSQNGGMDCL